MFRLLIVLAICCSIISCGTDEPTVQYQSAGIIKGADIALCACCGGYILNMDNSDNYRINTIPGYAGFSLDTLKFPVVVKLNWTLEQQCGSLMHINVEAIKLQ